MVIAVIAAVLLNVGVHRPNVEIVAVVVKSAAQRLVGLIPAGVDFLVVNAQTIACGMLRRSRGERGVDHVARLVLRRGADLLDPAVRLFPLVQRALSAALGQSLGAGILVVHLLGVVNVVAVAFVSGVVLQADIAALGDNVIDAVAVIFCGLQVLPAVITQAGGLCTGIAVVLVPVLLAAGILVVKALPAGEGVVRQRGVASEPLLAEQAHVGDLFEVLIGVLGVIQHRPVVRVVVIAAVLGVVAAKIDGLQPAGMVINEHHNVARLVVDVDAPPHEDGHLAPLCVGEVVVPLVLVVAAAAVHLPHLDVMLFVEGQPLRLDVIALDRLPAGADLAAVTRFTVLGLPDDLPLAVAVLARLFDRLGLGGSALGAGVGLHALGGVRRLGGDGTRVPIVRVGVGIGAVNAVPRVPLPVQL